MTDIRAKIDEWKKLAEAATPGPWLGNDTWRREVAEGPFIGPADKQPVAVITGYYDIAGVIANTAFISTAREAIPQLIAEYERLSAPVEAEVAKMVEQLRDNGYAPAGNAMPLRNQAADMLVRLSRPSAAGAEVRAERDGPVAWRVKDFADGWILFHSEAAAENEARATGAFIEPLYTGASLAPPVAAGEEG